MSEPSGQPWSADLDFAAIFARLPTAYLVLTPDLVIVSANDAYLALLGRTCEELAGRYVFDAFPPAAGILDEHGGNPMQLSFERARDTGRLDQVPLLEYDVVDPATGSLAHRFWSIVSAPVPGEDGGTALLLQRVEDVTDFVLERRRLERRRNWKRRVEVVEAELFTRVQELRVAMDAQERSARRLAGLAEAALQLAAADTVERLADIVVAAGLTALGADGGAIAVRDDAAGVVRLTITESLGPQARATFAELPLTSELPGAWAARTGETVLLVDQAAGLAWSPAMAQVHEATGRQAWAALPLRAGDHLLGSLVASWAEVHPFADDEVELLAAFAAQCAQALDRLQVREAERLAATATRRLSEALQRSLLTAPPQPDHLQIAVRYLPAAAEAQVGGDWYDAFMITGKVSLVIGDVAGHDQDAAAMMGQMRNLLRGVAHIEKAPPAAVLSALDLALQDLAVGALATAVLAQVEQSPADAARGLRVLRWSNAGHPPPLLLRPDGTAELLTRPPDLLLGLDPGTDRVDHTQELQPGSTVLFYTDGLIERRGASLDEGMAWLSRAVAGLAGVGLEQMCDALLAMLDTDVDDDVAVLAVRAHPEDRPRPPEAGPVVLPDDQLRQRQDAG